MIMDIEKTDNNIEKTPVKGGHKSRERIAPSLGGEIRNCTPSYVENEKAGIRPVRELTFMIAGDKGAVEYPDGVKEIRRQDVDLSKVNECWYLIPGRWKWTLLGNGKAEAVKGFFRSVEQDKAPSYFILFDNGELCRAAVYFKAKDGVAAEGRFEGRKKPSASQAAGSESLNEFIRKELIPFVSELPLEKEQKDSATAHLLKFAGDSAALNTVSGLIADCGSNIDVDQYFAEEIYKDGKIADPGYIEALKKLGRAGINIDGPLIASLTPKKAHDKEYVDSLVSLKEDGVDIVGALIDMFWNEISAHQSNYLVNLASVNKRILPNIEPEVMMEKVNGFIEKHREGLEALKLYDIEVDYETLMDWASLEKFDEGYLPALADLSAAGIKVDPFFMKRFSPSSIRALGGEYKDLLIELAGAGVTVDHHFIYMFGGMENNIKYRELILKLVAAGVTVDGNFIGLHGPDNEKELELFTDEYIAVLADLASSGVKFDSFKGIFRQASFSEAFPEKKARDEHYIATLKELAAAGVSVNGEFILSFDLEKSYNAGFVAKLKQVALSGKRVDCLTVNSVYKKYSHSSGAVQEVGFSSDQMRAGNVTVKTLSFGPTGPSRAVKVIILSDKEKEELGLDGQKYGETFCVAEGPRINDLYRYNRLTEHYELFGTAETRAK